MIAEGRAMITGVVLAGGRSLRMGRDKGSVTVCGRTLLSRSRDVLLAAFGRCIVVGPRTAAEGDTDPPGVVHCVDDPDVAGFKGPLAGIATAMRRAQTPFVFVLPCDSPLVNEAFVTHMADLALSAGDTACDAVVPRHDGQWEPLHAVYRTTLADAAADCAQRQTRIIALFDACRSVREVTSAELETWGPAATRAFANANTRDELFAVVREISNSERALRGRRQLMSATGSCADRPDFRFQELFSKTVNADDSSESLFITLDSTKAVAITGLCSRNVTAFAAVVAAVNKEIEKTPLLLAWLGNIGDLNDDALRYLNGIISVYSPIISREEDMINGAHLLEEMRRQVDDFDPAIPRGLLVRVLQAASTATLFRRLASISPDIFVLVPDSDAALLAMLEGIRVEVSSL